MLKPAIIQKTIEGPSVTLPVLQPTSDEPAARRTCQFALLILASVAQLPSEFQISKNDLRVKAGLSHREMAKGMRFLTEKSYAKLVATHSEQGTLNGQTYAFSFAGKVSELPKTVDAWKNTKSFREADQVKDVSGTRKKSWQTKLSETSPVQPHSLTPCTPYNVAPVDGSLNPQPPDESGGFTFIEEPGEDPAIPPEVAELVEASLSQLPEGTNLSAVRKAVSRELTTCPELALNIVEDQGLFPDRETQTRFLELNAKFGYVNPFTPDLDRAESVDAAIVAFACGDVKRWNLDKWLLPSDKPVTAARAFYEPLEKLARLPRLRQAGADEFMSETLAGVVLRDLSLGPVPYSEVRVILRQLRRGIMKPQQIMRAWLHTRLYSRVQPNEVCTLVQRCDILQPDDAYCFSHGLLMWKGRLTYSNRHEIAQVAKAVASVKDADHLAGWLAAQPRRTRAAAWWQAMQQEEEGSTTNALLREAFQLNGADPTFMALELLQTGQEYYFDRDSLAQENGMLNHAAVITHAICESRYFTHRLNKLMTELMELDVRSFDKQDIAPHRLYAV